MRNEMIRVAKEHVDRNMKNMSTDEREAPGDSSAKVTPPIEYVTENGFNIVRLSDLQPSIVDSESECHFLVRQPDGKENGVSVDFADRVVLQVHSQRNSCLSDTSDFWLTLAEQHLATYVWRNNHSPANGHLAISQLSGHDLVLAASWRD